MSRSPEQVVCLGDVQGRVTKAPPCQLSAITSGFTLINALGLCAGVVMIIMATGVAETFLRARPHKAFERWVLPAVCRTEKG